MSKAEHTQGPWKMAEDGSPFVYALNANGYNRFYLSVQGGDDDYRKPISISELKKIARLIAEAPTTAAERDKLSEVNKELLDALEELLKHVPVPAVQMGKQFSDPFPVPECIAKARAAIAKANGE